MTIGWVSMRAMLFALVATVPASAADEVALPVADGAAIPASWTGAYAGGQAGYGTGGLGTATTAQLDQGLFLPASITGLIGGLQAGYNSSVGRNIVLGVEADIAFPSPIDVPANHPAAFTTSVEYIGTARARVGYAIGRALPFVTGGFAWGRSNTVASDPAGAFVSATPVTHTGWTVGAGVEFLTAGPWTGKFEYGYVKLGPKFAGVTVEPDAHAFKIGMNYRFGTSPSPAPSGVPESDFKTWNIHVQSTAIAQGYPAFRSAYAGGNSLPAGGETRETWTATAFVGVRIAKGVEVYVDPELGQGGGIGKTLGLAGFANGEAQKGDAEFPKFRAQRYFVRQTIGLGGAQETVEDGPNQLAGSQDINRLTLTAGRFAVSDFFDNNAYAHDPRADFMNWALWEAAAYDFPADLPGFTRGAVAELNTRDWTLRGGLFQVPDAPNSDVLGFKTGGVVAELEQRYMLGPQSGKLRLGAFANNGFTGNYNAALQASAANPALDITTTLTQTRADRLKYGFYANIEQSLTTDLGIFARASWNDGRNEILSFSDIDASLSGGVSVKGTAWGRADDVVGFGATINGLSGSHRAFLAAGGLGQIIGDGALTYRPEEILETYYALNLAKGRTLTTDYQFVANPAYNADRGPVSILATRLHVEF